MREAEEGERVGLQGSLKAARDSADGGPLSAKRYLKTPDVFGFQGVYRQLARALGVEDSGRLGETGFDLLNVWAREQQLEGFAGSESGPGKVARVKLKDAVQAGLEKGATARGKDWAGWDFFRKHLAPSPYTAVPKEAKSIYTALVNDRKGFRREVIECLISPKGCQAWEETDSEREFHQALRTTASQELR